MKATTPSTISESVIQLRARIGAVSEPVFLPVQPAPHSTIDECFRNVDRQVEERGGVSIRGWCVWEDSGRFIEGVFHAVWQSPDGALIDITPHQDGEMRILFILDDRIQYHGKPIPSVRLPLARNRQVLRAVRIAEDMEKLRLRYLLPDGRAAVPAREVLSVIASHTTRNDLCPCQSGRKFKHCCESLPLTSRFSRWAEAARQAHLHQPKP